jgi:hypothetical protein
MPHRLVANARTALSQQILNSPLVGAFDVTILRHPITQFSLSAKSKVNIVNKARRLDGVVFVSTHPLANVIGL